MVVTNNAKNRLRDLIRTDISSVELGTGGSDASVNDIGLESGVTETNKMPSITTGNRTLTITHTLSTAEGNGNTFREAGIFINSDSVLLDRVVFPDTLKTESIELTTIDVIRVD